MRIRVGPALTAVLSLAAAAAGSAAHAISAPLVLTGAAKAEAGRFTPDAWPDVVAVPAGTGATWVYPGDGTGTSDVAARTEVRLIG